MTEMLDSGVWRSTLSLVCTREIDELFDSFTRGFGLGTLGTFGGPTGFSPKVDVAETDKEVKVTAELPGIDEGDIDVSLENDMLTIKGEKKEEKEDKGEGYYRVERSYGSFTRAVPLPVEVVTDKAEAKFKKGILTVTLPKTPDAIAGKKKIEITTG